MYGVFVRKSKILRKVVLKFDLNGNRRYNNLKLKTFKLMTN